MPGPARQGAARSGRRRLLRLLRLLWHVGLGRCGPHGSRQQAGSAAGGPGTLEPMPTFDVVSKLEMQEVRNAVDQAQREVANRFDFKDTGSSLELDDGEVRLQSSTEDRLRALVQVLEEKLVRRQVSLKALDYGKVEEGSRGTLRQSVGLRAGLNAEHAKALNKWVKDHGPKGVSSQTQGDQLRVSGKKRDDLQAVITGLRGGDFGIPLQFENFRD